MKKYLSRSILKTPLLTNIWFNLAKNLNFNNIKVGHVYKINYLSISLGDVQVKTFMGLCLYKRNNTAESQSFCLRNFYKIESIEIVFFINSPMILHIEEMSNYKRKTSLCKLYYMRNLKRKSYKN